MTTVIEKTYKAPPEICANQVRDLKDGESAYLTDSCIYLDLEKRTWIDLFDRTTTKDTGIKITRTNQEFVVTLIKSDKYPEYPTFRSSDVDFTKLDKYRPAKIELLNQITP